jgi:hypothetical protein
MATQQAACLPSTRKAMRRLFVTVNLLPVSNLVLREQEEILGQTNDHSLSVTYLRQDVTAGQAYEINIAIDHTDCYVSCQV